METSKQNGFGRYGDLRKEYMQRFWLVQYQALVQTGTFEQHLKDREARAQEWIAQMIVNDVLRCPCPREPIEVGPWITEMGKALKDMEQTAVILFINGD